MIPAAGFEGREVAVLGLGRSGLPAARALLAGGARPVLWDDAVSGRLQAEAEGFVVEDLSKADWRRFAALVLSPGVPLTHPRPHWTVELARQAGVPTIGDIELFARAVDALPPEDRPRVVAVTGTNGKSTTTALIGWVLKQAGLTVHVGGNIGVGVLALPAPTPGAVYVLEVSSYQLDLAASFAPDVAILINLSPDHLDRHGGMEGYVAAKRRIFQNQTPAQTAVVGVDDGWGLVTAAALESAGRRVVRVSAEKGVRGGVYVTGGQLVDASEGEAMTAADLAEARALPGRHNAQNAACAWAAARALGLTPGQARAGLISFPGLAHRMEDVGRIGGVRFINDSKATNADAARQALMSYPRSFWIAGGRAKAGGVEALLDLLPRVAHAYLVGEAAEPFAAAIGARAPWTVSGTVEQATARAFADATAAGGEQVVLLSPACASFDQFPDFEARGEAFRAAVRGLQAEAAA